MTTASQFRQCSHIKADGVQCGSPALHASELCFFHHPTAREAHRLKEVALRPDPMKVTLRHIAEIWPADFTSRKHRSLLEYALRISSNLSND